MTKRCPELPLSGDVDLRGEYWFFVRWIITKRQFYLTVCWVFRKLRNRCFRLFNGYRVYPNELRVLILKCRDIHDGWISEDNGEIGLGSKAPKSLSLAGDEIAIVNGHVDWLRTFIDREDEESLHRWNFLLHLIGREKRQIDCLHWAANQISEWIGIFQNEIQTQKKGLGKNSRWESYTISERLSNSSIFFHVSKIEPSKNLTSALIDQAQYLTKHLEYHGDYTGNHIVNNGRGLYLFGVTFDIESFRTLGKLLLERELPNLVSPAGFVREGSSHYQLLITRWVLEVNYFCRKHSDLDFRQTIGQYCEKLEDKCRFFMPENSHSGNKIYPLFGDISPDFPPEWLSDLLTSRLSCNQQFDHSSSRLPELSWNWIWN